MMPSTTDSYEHEEQRAWLGAFNGVTKRDLLFCLLAAIAGIAAALLPHASLARWNDPTVSIWIRRYIQFFNYALRLPWAIGTVAVQVALLFSIRFRRAALGVAFCLGITLVLVFRNAIR